MSNIRRIAPDIYTKFACKCGACRSTCCSAWGISVSDTEYFRLLGQDCSPALRRRLDCAFVPAEPPSPERYAMLSPSYAGNCRLLSESGLCSLQLECGEGVLPLICRVYPRALRDMGAWLELSTSLSCERTAELLLSTPAPLTFCDTAGEAPAHTIAGGRSDGEASALRRELFSILGDRSLRLSERVLRLCERVLGRAIPRPKSGEAAAELISRAEAFFSLHRESEHLRELGERAAAELSRAASAAEALAAGEARLVSLLGDPEPYLERILIHHLFYMQIPFAASELPPEQQIAAFLSAYTLLSYLLRALPIASESDLVDAVSKLFRFLEHSGFYFRARNGVSLPV